MIWCYDTVLWYGAMIWCYDTVLWYGVMIRCYDTVLWYGAMIRCCDTLLWYGVTVWCYDMLLWYGAMIWCYDMVLWYGAMIRCYEMMLWYGAMIRCYDTQVSFKIKWTLTPGIISVIVLIKICYTRQQSLISFWPLKNFLWRLLMCDTHLFRKWLWCSSLNVITLKKTFYGRFLCPVPC